MPELTVTQPVALAPSEPAPAYQPPASIPEWFRQTSPITPPPDDFEITEYRAVPPQPGEHSRTTVTTRAGITMTVIVTWAQEPDGPPQQAHLSDIAWGCVRYHVVTNNIQPRVHMEQIVALELTADHHSSVVNELVRRIQEVVLRQRRETEEAFRRQQAVVQQNLLTSFAVPQITVNIPTNTPTRLQFNGDTTTGIYTYTMNLRWEQTGTTITTVPYNITFNDNWVYNYNNWAFQTSAPVGTPEQQAEIRAQREQRQAEIKAQREQRDKEVADANRQAEKLLLDLLGDMGFARYKRKGYVLVMSRTKPGVVYRVKGMAGIDLYERKNGKIVSLQEYLCIHPQEVYPEADTIAAQVMLCRHDEETLWKTANIHKRGSSINLGDMGGDLFRPVLVDYVAA